VLVLDERAHADSHADVVRPGAREVRDGAGAGAPGGRVEGGQAGGGWSGSGWVKVVPLERGYREESNAIKIVENGAILSELEPIQDFF
jgi:hypothetical protein